MFAMQAQQSSLKLHGDTLHGQHNEVLAQGEKLVSQDQAHCLVMHHDGNLVCYHGTRPVWASGSEHRGCGPYSLVMQHDRNLVIYGGAHGSTWKSGTHGKGTGPARLVMQNDGNVVVYDAHNHVLWHK